MCIYYKGIKNLTYEGQDHIFLASIGGRLKLPTYYVSKEFNNHMSNLEGKLVHSSLLSIARVIDGPGKRGSLKEKYATKSEILIIRNAYDENMFALGYLKLGKPYEIPHVTINCVNKEIEFSLEKSELTEINAIVNNFKEKCSQPHILKVKEIIVNDLLKDIILFGVSDDVDKNYNAFFAKNEINTNHINDELIKSIGKAINIEGQIPESMKYTPLVKRTMVFDSEHLRIFGKMAFNYLAHICGNDFVLNDRFDKVRDWIVYGENEFAFLNTTPNPIEKMISFPESYHMVLICKIENSLIGKVIAYRTHCIDIMLCKNFTDPFPTRGLICDWKNQKEDDLYDFLNNKLSPI